MQLNRTKKAVPTVLVLGGYGFIGRYTVDALKTLKLNVLIGSRRCSNSANPDRQVKLHESLTTVAWTDVLRNVDVVINCVGILRERRNETYEAVHHLAVASLALACAANAIPLIHMSALGITGPVKNRFSLSKLRGEQAIIATGGQSVIVRASVVDAPDGYGSSWFHRLAQWPVWPLPAGARHRLCPISAVDLGEALATLALKLFKQTTSPAKPEIVELGCCEAFTLESYLQRLRQDDCPSGVSPLLIVRIPQSMAKAFAIICDYLHLTPYSAGHHELLESDNLPAMNLLPQLLGREPTRISASDTSINLLSEQGHSQ